MKERRALQRKKVGSVNSKDQFVYEGQQFYFRSLDFQFKFLLASQLEFDSRNTGYCFCLFSHGGLNQSDTSASVQCVQIQHLLAKL